MEWDLVFKALAPLTGKAATSLASNLLRSWQVAFETKRKAKERGIQVKYFALRRMIDDHHVFKLFHTPTPEGMEALAPALRSCIKQAENVVSAEAVVVLLEIMANAYVHSLTPSQASRFEGETPAVSGEQPQLILRR